MTATALALIEERIAANRAHLADLQTSVERVTDLVSELESLADTIRKSCQAAALVTAKPPRAERGSIEKYILDRLLGRTAPLYAADFDAGEYTSKSVRAALARLAGTGRIELADGQYRLPADKEAAQ